MRASHWGLGESSAYVILRYPSTSQQQIGDCSFSDTHSFVVRHREVGFIMPSLPLLSSSSTFVDVPNKKIDHESCYTVLPGIGSESKILLYPDTIIASPFMPM